MGKSIKRKGREIKERWHQKMPRFFRQLVVLCVCIVGTAFGINTMLQMTGAVPHDWWNDIYPLLIGIPTGMTIVCKLTVAGGYKDINPNNLTKGNTILDKDIDHMRAESPDDDRDPHMDPIDASDM